jgi:GPH family glycoside/pentoside/hexuronide:cation symporter
MSQATHYETAPEDRIPFQLKLIYGLGAFVNNLLAAAIGGMVIVLNLGLGMNPALVGLLGALPRLTDALTDPVMGYISDNTRSRWGRRRPYIFAGAIVAGVVFALLWQLPAGRSESFYFWYFLVGSLIFYLGYTIFATPWVALGYELTPDYHERTRLMGVQNFVGQLAYVVAPWFLLFMQSKTYFDDMVDGAAGLAILIAIVTITIGVLPAIFLRERFKALPVAAVQGHHEKTVGAFTVMNRVIRDFFRGFATTLKSRPFVKLCVATFLVFNGFMLISSFGFYVIIYYVFRGDKVLGAEYAGYAGTLSAISTFVVIMIVTWLGTRIGKRKAFFAAIGLSMVGYALKWFCYNPDLPWLLLLPAPFLAFGLGGLFTLMPAMICDVVDLDELETHERREGMYGSIFWWVVKLGMAAALAAGGFLLNATGFDVALEGNQAQSTITLMRLFDAFVPFVTSGVAIWAIASFSITEERAREIRLELERRRGSLDAPKAAVPLSGKQELPSGSARHEPIPPAARRSSNLAKELYKRHKTMTREETIALYRGPVSLQGFFSADISDEDLRSQFRHVIDGKIHGLSFSPYVEGQGPGTRIGEPQIRNRLAIIQPHISWLRTFSCTEGNEEIPRIAHESGLKTLVGIWLQGDHEKNEKELENAIRVAGAGLADIVAVGNEVLLRGDLSEDELLGYIHRFKEAVPGAQVGYADAYFQFIDHPRVTDACDVILANCYPFWEGCAAEHATLYAKEMYRRTVQVANGKKVIISETGWPNIGTPVGGAVPSETNAIRYFLNICKWAEEDGIEVFYFSSFDETWKIRDEGDVGAFWGLWDKDGRLKYV